jgi:hypothetical protein
MYRCVFCSQQFTAEQVKTLLVPVRGSEHNTRRQMFTSTDRRQIHDLIPVVDDSADSPMTMDCGTF